MNAILPASAASIIEGPADWRAADMTDTSEWVISLTAAQIVEIDQALQATSALDLADLTKENFALPSFTGLSDEILDRLENGRGFVVLRGFPALNYDKAQLRKIFWGIGKHIGTAVSQSSKGDLLGDVRDFGQDVFSSAGRGYMSSQKLGFHCDTSDVVALMVLRTAKSGGLSKIASSVAVRNEIARTRPDLLEVLYTPFNWSWKGQEGPGEAPYYQQPVYSEHKGKFCSRDIKTHIFSAHKDNLDLGPLTPKQLEALALINTIVEDPKFHFCMMFEPGDIQFLNNHITLHSRTAFEDHEEEDRKRHLLRMWLSPPNSRELSPAMSAIYRDQSAGAVRGGFPSRTGAHSFETVKAQD
jgi:hypothetical protein